MITITDGLKTVVVTPGDPPHDVEALYKALEARDVPRAEHQNFEEWDEDVGAMSPARVVELLDGWTLTGIEFVIGAKAPE